MDPEERRALFAAGAAALRFNAPLSDRRADGLVDFIAEGAPASVVDLGCGRGAFAALLSGGIDGANVIGVDNDEGVIAAATSLTEGRSTLRFELADAADWRGPVDAVVCIGASHAFGDAGAMVRHLASIGATRTVIGDGVWSRTPDRWCLETFGELPVGAEALATLARSEGWSVIEAAASTPTEWDAFELGWIDGVRSVGTGAARAFADQRQADYERYRGTLGFAWLCLVRP